MCYICHETGGRVRCKCRMPIHDDCLIRLLNTVPNARAGRCVICNNRYTGVRLRSPFQLEFDYEYVFTTCVLVGCTLILTGVCGSYIWIGQFTAGKFADAAPFLFITGVNTIVIYVTCRQQLRRHGVFAALTGRRRVFDRFENDAPSVTV